MIHIQVPGMFIGMLQCTYEMVLVQMVHLHDGMMLVEWCIMMHYVIMHMVDA